jgi:putative NADH-flavin reductase
MMSNNSTTQTCGVCASYGAAGATGGVGKRVVQRLLSQGRVVRALVRDLDKARSLLVSRTSL